ncbi:MAG: zinc-dependent peptidase, partial [Saprospiraceae bacterium]
PMFGMLMNTAPHFASMPMPQQLLMADRMKRWMIRKEFLNKNEQDAPEDVKYILAYYAILLTIHQEDFQYKNFERVVFYHHPFLTPDHPDDVHIVEVEAKDGTIIISVPHLLKGHLEKGYYNLALHAMADAFYMQYLNHPIAWPDNIWLRLEGISGISREKLEDYIGLPLSDPWPVAVHHQLTYADADIPEVLEHFPQFRNKLS